MPVQYCESNGKYRIGDGDCIYDTKETAEEAQQAYYAQQEKSKGLAKEVRNTELAKEVDKDKQIFTSIVLKANEYDDDGFFSDYWPEDVVEEAAHEFMMVCQKGNVGHIFNTDAIKVIESYIAPVDFELGNGVVNKGDWVMSTKIVDSALWELCKSGEFKGYSINCGAIVQIEDKEE